MNTLAHARDPKLLDMIWIIDSVILNPPNAISGNTTESTQAVIVLLTAILLNLGTLYRSLYRIVLTVNAMHIAVTEASAIHTASVFRMMVIRDPASPNKTMFFNRDLPCHLS